jgi:hypothetical protein
MNQLYKPLILNDSLFEIPLMQELIRALVAKKYFK